MSDVIHVTERALDVVRCAEAMSTPDTRACDGRPANVFFSGGDFCAGDAQRLLADRPLTEGSAMPTCSVCRVLLDAALEGRDLRGQLKVVTP